MVLVLDLFQNYIFVGIVIVGGGLRSLFEVSSAKKICDFTSWCSFDLHKPVFVIIRKAKLSIGCEISILVVGEASTSWLSGDSKILIELVGLVVGTLSLSALTLAWLCSVSTRIVWKTFLSLVLVAHSYQSLYIIVSKTLIPITRNISLGIVGVGIVFQSGFLMLSSSSWTSLEVVIEIRSFYPIGKDFLVRKVYSLLRISSIRKVLFWIHFFKYKYLQASCRSHFNSDVFDFNIISSNFFAFVNISLFISSFVYLR